MKKATKKKPAKISLRKARTDKDLLEIARDNKSYGRFHLMRDWQVIRLSEQVVGEIPVWSVEIPKEAFDFLIDFYQKEQKRVKENYR